MKAKNLRGWIVGLIIVLAIFVADAINYRGRMKRLERSLSTEDVPPPDYTRGKPLFYSIQKKAWIYSTQSGAIAPHIANKPYEDHETFLKRNVPIYKKKTYWGDEWDEHTGQEQDIIWDDEGDDNETKK
jgi:hypothetical protein